VKIVFLKLIYTDFLITEAKLLVTDVHLRKSESYAKLEILSSHYDFQMGFYCL